VPSSDGGAIEEMQRYRAGRDVEKGWKSCVRATPDGDNRVLNVEPPATVSESFRDLARVPAHLDFLRVGAGETTAEEVGVDPTASMGAVQHAPAADYNPGTDVGEGWTGGASSGGDIIERQPRAPEPSGGLDSEAGLREHRVLPRDEEWMVSSQVDRSSTQLSPEVPGPYCPPSTSFRDLDSRHAFSAGGKVERDDAHVTNTEPPVDSSELRRLDVADDWNSASVMRTEAADRSVLNAEPSEGAPAASFRDEACGVEAWRRGASESPQGLGVLGEPHGDDGDSFRDLEHLPRDREWQTATRPSNDDAAVIDPSPSILGSVSEIAPRAYDVLPPFADWKVPGGGRPLADMDASLIDVEPSSGCHAHDDMRSLDRMPPSEDWQVALRRQESPPPIDLERAATPPAAFRDESSASWTPAGRAPSPQKPPLDTVPTAISEQIARHRFRDLSAPPRKEAWNTATKTSLLETKYDRRVRVRKRRVAKKKKRANDGAVAATPTHDSHDEVVALKAYLAGLKACGGDAEEMAAVMEMLGGLGVVDNVENSPPARASTSTKASRQTSRRPPREAITT